MLSVQFTSQQFNYSFTRSQPPNQQVQTKIEISLQDPVEKQKSDVLGALHLLQIISKAYPTIACWKYLWAVPQ